MLILIVEDEIELAQLVIEYLEGEGVECDHAASCKEAEYLLKITSFDVIVMDANLPDGTGFDVCNQYRRGGNNTPIIMLTARGSLQDKAKGFSIGVDDYLVKPFAMEELLMRLHALSQRANRSDVVSAGIVSLNVVKHQASLGGHELELSPDEWRLLLLLVSRENETIKKEKIMSHIWPDDTGTDDALKMLLFRLRKNIRHTLVVHELGEQQVEIISVRGVGLRLSLA